MKVVCARAPKFFENEKFIYKISQIFIFENFGVRAPILSTFEISKNHFFFAGGVLDSKFQICACT